MSENLRAFEQQPSAEPSGWGRIRLPLFTARLVYGLIAFNVLIFLVDMLQSRIWLFMGGIIPDLIIQRAEYWRVLTAGFLHFDLTHLVFNMWGLYILGKEAETLYGSARFGLGYLTAIVSSSVLMTAFQPMRSLGAGASGGLLGIAGLLMVYFYWYRNWLDTRAALLSLGRMVFINLALGLLPGISLWGHLGGFLGGLVAGLLLYPRYKWPLWSATGGTNLTIQSLTSQQWAYLTALWLAFPVLLMAIIMVRG